MATSKQFDRIISADSHVVEPLDTWWKALGHKFGDRTPRVVDEWEGRKGRYFYTGYLGAPVTDLSLFDPTPETEAAAYEANEQGFEACGYDPAVRVRWQEQAGISAEIMNSTNLLAVMRNPDTEVLEACAEVFNDWEAEFCSYDPKRLIGVSVIPMHNLDWAIKELERTTKKGIKGPMINCQAPEGCKPYWHRDYDRFWAVAQDLGVPLSLHLLTGRKLDPLVYADTNTPEQNMENPREWVELFNEIQGVLASDFIFGGIFDRFPSLKILNSEFEMSWVPNLMSLLDQIESIGPRMKVPTLKMRASEYIKTRVWHGFIDDRAAEYTIPAVGASQVLWGSDFPHLRSIGLEAQSAITQLIEKLPRNEQEMVVATNTAKLFNLN